MHDTKTVFERIAMELPETMRARKKSKAHCNLGQKIRIVISVGYGKPLAMNVQRNLSNS